MHIHIHIHTYTYMHINTHAFISADDIDPPK